jgi:group I intron endonuclease
MNNIIDLFGEVNEIKTLSEKEYSCFPLKSFNQISEIRNFLNLNGGIYCWIDESSKKVYIGSAKNLWNRFRTYKNFFFYGKTTRINKKLMAFNKKYGFANIKFYILEIFNGEEEDLRTLEQKYLNECCPFGKNGFNISKNTIKYKKSILHEDVIKKIKEANTGENSSNAKLNNKKVLSIKNKLSEGCKLIDLAREFGVSTTVISNIKRGLTWGHVETSTEVSLKLQELTNKHKRLNLSEDLVRKIKKEINCGRKMKDISVEYGLRYTCISGLKYGSFYKSVAIE